ncbi:anaerobic ribonucleoside-triphosphate reductase activating protein [candidate division WWE3 bacterium CG08_land_8_20_14_0_20_43_13]|uniref:Anaerobic ribonucleoside-triphosphate reductase activating protein n=1 Tax=candidate division WWE3 bacterium CG08_land_8_20_14_0_20_43_13 TaxID=1975087 RepID=A0A2H0X8Z9_UNCKA|nr:MAG: anaerobic ribonucleoside-triphosphate reductase activating protein [candidate division WWE3 bacterium CG08_land_8_20_14_0_20_43_13]
MYLAALQKISLLDYPEKVAAVVFTAGCNFNCPFCHNRQLVVPQEYPCGLDEGEFFDFLLKRQGLLDGVVFTGGEPSLQPDLREFIGKVKELGFLVKLDTNGSCPKVVSDLLSGGQLDYIAVDVKAPFDQRYELASGISVDLLSVKETLNKLLLSNVFFELRTTVVPGLHTIDWMTDLACQLKDRALAPRAPWFLQPFEPKNCLNNEYLARAPHTKLELNAILESVKNIYHNVSLR